MLHATGSFPRGNLLNDFVHYDAHPTGNFNGNIFYQDFANYVEYATGRVSESTEVFFLFNGVYDYIGGSFHQPLSWNDFSDYVVLAIGKFHKEHGLKWPVFIKFKQP